MKTTKGVKGIIPIKMHGIMFFVTVVLPALLSCTCMGWLLGQRPSRARSNDTFLAALIPDDGSVLSCACLQGNIARYLIEYGPNVGGPMCLNCARAEFVGWCLQQCDKRLTKHAEELDHLAIEYNPDPPPPQTEQVQP